MSSLADRFLSLHSREGAPLLLPNPWDAGSAKILESLGFEALATTSSGFAATLGRLDGSVTRDEAIAHAAQVVEAVSVPVNADLENLFAADLDAVGETVRLALGAGLAGCSVEDWSGHEIYEREEATARVEAAVAAADGGIVLTARSENFIRGRPDLADTVARLEAFQEAGADVLYAPGLRSLDDIRSVVSSLDRPLNVLALPGAPPVAELAEAGVARVSVGGAFAFAALGALVAAGRELLDHGTYGFWEQAGPGAKATREAFAATEPSPGR